MERKIHNLFQGFKLKTAIALIALSSASAFAHNQNPAVIRRAMDKAFQSLGATVPANVLKGNRSVRISGTNAQVFDIKKDGKTVGSVAQLEIQEKVNVVAVDVLGAKVTAVVQDGSSVEETEWKELGFVNETLKTLSGK